MADCAWDMTAKKPYSDAMKKEAEMDQVAFRTGTAAHNTSLASSQPTQDRDLVQTVKQTEIADEAGGSGTATAEGATGGEELLGAVGGAWRPNTVADVLRMEGVDQLFAVQPLPWCPHLASVQPLPPGGLNTSLPCQQCGDRSENWVCLICYQVFCSRYVQEHMLFHSVEENHLVVLSFSDLSVWCYACNDYIDNQITYPMKNSAHRHKFGEPLPNTWQQQ